MDDIQTLIQFNIAGIVILVFVLLKLAIPLCQVVQLVSHMLVVLLALS